MACDRIRQRNATLCQQLQHRQRGEGFCDGPPAIWGFRRCAASGCGNQHRLTPVQDNQPHGRDGLAGLYRHQPFLQCLPVRAGMHGARRADDHAGQHEPAKIQPDDPKQGRLSGAWNAVLQVCERWIHGLPIWPRPCALCFRLPLDPSASLLPRGSLFFTSWGMVRPSN